MNGPAFVGDRRPPERPSLLDFVCFDAFALGIWPVREFLRPEPWPVGGDALLIEKRGARTSTRDVSLDVAFAVGWEGEA